MLEGMNRSFEVVIVDNGSSDSTARVAEDLAANDSRIRFEHLPRAGRGAALKTGWLSSQARIVSYMDIDLSTDLSCFPFLIEPIQRQEAEFVIGSRLMPGADVTRCWQREWISRSYVSLLRVA
jgi:glycosyltransferase involved in cell wall biosynthesis